MSTVNVNALTEVTAKARQDVWRLGCDAFSTCRLARLVAVNLSWSQWRSRSRWQRLAASRRSALPALSLSARGARSTKKGNAVKKDSISTGLVASGIGTAWEDVTASFERVLSDRRHRDPDRDDGRIRSSGSAHGMAGVQLAEPLAT